MSAIVSVKNLCKGYGNEPHHVPVLKDVSCTIEQGEIVALVGQSGSGKSTLLNLIGALDSPDKGEMTVCGVDYQGASEKKLAALRNREIGFVFQSFHLLDTKTCLQNVMLPSLFDSEIGLSEQDGLAALERVGLKDMAKRLPGELSGGQKQRVAIARACLCKPSLLLCDEPTGNLDSDTGKEVIEFFGALNREDGVTLLIVTHEERLSRFAHRVIRMRDGKLVNESSIGA